MNLQKPQIHVKTQIKQRKTRTNQRKIREPMREKSLQSREKVETELKKRCGASIKEQERREMMRRERSLGISDVGSGDLRDFR